MTLRSSLEAEANALLLSFIILSVFLPSLLPAQNQTKADSLITVMDQADDSTRLHLLDKVASLSSSPEDKIKFGMQQLELAIKLNSKKGQVLAYINTGVGYRKKGNLDQGLEYLFKSASLASEIGDKANLCIAYGEIATTYSKSGDIENSLQYNTRSIEVLREIGDIVTLALTLLNTGYEYYKANKYDTALLYYNEAQPIFDSLGIYYAEAYAIGNKALVKWKLGNADHAIEDLKLAISMLKPLGDDYGMADFHNQLGSIYLENGELGKAAESLSRGIKMAKKVDLKEQVRDASKLLSEIFTKQNNFDSAYNYLLQYVALKDTVAGEEVVQKLANQRADYEINLKQAELEASEARRKNQFIISLAISVFLLVVAIVAYIFYRNYQEKLKLSKELENLNTSQKKLFSIISHDLRGPLASFASVGFMIRSSVKSGSYDLLLEVAREVEKTSKRLSELMESLLSWAVSHNSSMSVHLESLSVKRLFLDLKDTYYSQAKVKGIEIDISEADNSQINADRNMTYTIFRNLLSNAIKFTPSGGRITVKSETEERKVIVKVIDTGIGIPNEKLDELFDFKGEKTSFGTHGEKGLGLGLSLVKEFVEVNNGTIEVSSQINLGTTFIVTLPAVG